MIATYRRQNVDEAEYDVVHGQVPELQIRWLFAERASRCRGRHRRRFLTHLDEREDDASDASENAQTELRSLWQNDEHQKTQIVLRTSGRANRTEFV